MAIEDPLFLQALTYSAAEWRTLTEAVAGEGVVDMLTGGLQVTQRGLGANETVDVAPGLAVITGDGQANQGRYVDRSNTVVNVPIAAAPATDARIDLIVLQIEDAAVTGTGNRGNIYPVVGTVAVSPVAPAVPNTAIPLAEVLRNAGDTSVSTARITDRRYLSGRAVPTAKAIRTTPQSIPSGQQWGAQWQSELWDNDGMFDLGVNVERATIRTPGLYEVRFNWRWDNVVGGLREGFIQQGSSYVAYDSKLTAAGHWPTHSIAADVDCPAGTVIVAGLNQTSGVNQSSIITGQSSSLSIVWKGPRP